MQDIDEHHHVERSILERQTATIERFDGDRRLRPHQHVDAADLHVRPLLPDQPRDLPVAAAHVQHTGIRWQQSRHMPAQHPRAAAGHTPLVNPLDPCHRRDIPRMLTKNPDSTV
jgi:hypothetical protein